MTNDMKQKKYQHQKPEVKVIPLNEIPTLARVSCAFKSDKFKKRRACYFGDVTLDDKVIRQGEYLLIQNENIHKNRKVVYERVPRGDR